MEFRVPSDNRVEPFWEPYDNILKIFRIPDKAIPWYRRHVHSVTRTYPSLCPLILNTGDDLGPPNSIG